MERKTDHDDEGAAVEEPSVDVRDEPDGERTNRGGDVALVAEAGAGEVVGRPSDAGGRDEEVLRRGRARRSTSIEDKRQAYQRTSSRRFHGAWNLKLRKSEYIGTDRKAGQTIWISESHSGQEECTHPTTARACVATTARVDRGSSHM